MFEVHSDKKNCVRNTNGNDSLKELGVCLTVSCATKFSCLVYRVLLYTTLDQAMTRDYLL